MFNFFNLRLQPTTLFLTSFCLAVSVSTATNFPALAIENKQRSIYQINQDQQGILTEKAEEISEQILEIVPTIESVDEKSRVLIGLAEIYGQFKNIQTIQSGLDRILELTKKIDDSESYNKSRILIALASSYSQIKDPELVNIGLAKTLEAAQNLDSRNYKSKYKSEILGKIAFCYEQNGDTQTAYDLLEEALEIALSQEDDFYVSQSLEVIVHTYISLKDNFKTKEDLAEILDFLQTLESSQSGDASSFQYSILSAIRLAYAEFPNIKIPDSILHQMLEIAQKFEPHRQFDFLRLMMNSSKQLERKESTNKFLTQAVTFLDSINNSEQKVNFLIAIATAYGEIGKTEIENRLLSQAWEMTLILDEYEKSWPLRNLAYANSSLGQSELVEMRLSQILQETQTLDSYAKALTLHVIAEAYWDIGNIETANKILDETLELARLQPGEWGNPEMLVGIARTYEWWGNLNMSNVVLQEALKSSLLLSNDGWSSLALDRITASYSGFEDMAIAREGLALSLDATLKLKEPIFKSRALMAIASAYENIGDSFTADEILDQAMFWTLAIDDSRNPEYFKSESLIGIAKVYSQIQDKAIVQDGLAKLLKTTNSMANTHHKFEVLQVIAAAYQQIGELKIAQGILDQTRDIIYKFELAIEKAENLILIAQSYVRLSKEEAICNNLINFKDRSCEQP